MELHDGGLDQIVAEEPVVVEEVGAGAGEGGLAALLGLAVLVHQAQLVLVIEPVDRYRAFFPVSRDVLS